VSRSTNGMDVGLVIIGGAVREVDPRDIHSGRDEVRDPVSAGRADCAYLLGSRSVHDATVAAPLRPADC
jgi:hypothetical protein